jgi:hypothetical protein
MTKQESLYHSFDTRIVAAFVIIALGVISLVYVLYRMNKGRSKREQLRQDGQVIKNEAELACSIGMGIDMPDNPDMSDNPDLESERL